MDHLPLRLRREKLERSYYENVMTVVCLLLELSHVFEL